MNSRRLAVLGCSGVAAAAALAIAGVEPFDTGTAQQLAAADSRLPRPPSVVAEDWFTQAATDGSAGRGHISDGEIPSPLRATDTRRAAMRAVAALAEMPGQLVDSALADAALSHVDPAVREEAVHALGERGGTIALQSLQQALQDPSPRVREEAFRALVFMGGNAAVPALGSALGTEDVSTRLNAVEALGEIGGPDAVRYLEPMLQDENDVVREAAAQWLAELSGASG